VLVERLGGKPLVVTGLFLQAVSLVWLGVLTTPTTPYLDMVPAFVIAGVGMTLFFVPLASLVLGSAPKEFEGQSSGTNAAFRELGGVFGIAVLGAVFSSHGGYGSPHLFVSGLTPAIFFGSAVVAVGGVTALLVPGRSRKRSDATSVDPSDTSEQAQLPADLVGAM
jgi:MFS family permease